MLLLMIERGMPIDIVLTADTGMEFPEMYDHLAKLDEYRERRNAKDEETQARYSVEIEQQTAALRENRRELRLCHRIQSDVPRVSQQCQQAQDERQENLKKEEHEHEYQRRNR